jgi:hypothetical protein
MEIHTNNDKTIDTMIKTNDASSTLNIIQLSVQEPDMLMDTGKL